ncbi:MAG: signal peptidase I [Pseudomonadota bacterium]|nr:MAG: signal peptidase I [Pseudomonadota bacterium]
MTRNAKWWKEWSGFAVIVFLMFVFRSAVADWYEVPTGSMKPTIVEGDRIFVNKLAYDVKVPFTLVSLARWEHPQRGDIVVFDSPTDAQRLVKRVVGLPGDSVELRNNCLIVNGMSADYSLEDQTMVERYWPQSAMRPVLYEETFNGHSHTITVVPQLARGGRDFGPVVVPDEHVFVLGDNRDNSADSRFIGPIDERLILGRARGVVLSFHQPQRFLLELH